MLLNSIDINEMLISIILDQKTGVQQIYSLFAYYFTYFSSWLTNGREDSQCCSILSYAAVS